MRFSASQPPAYCTRSRPLPLRTNVSDSLKEAPESSSPLPSPLPLPDGRLPADVLENRDDPMLLAALEVGHSLTGAVWELRVMPQLKVLQQRCQPRLVVEATCRPPMGGDRSTANAAGPSSPFSVLCSSGQRAESAGDVATKLNEGVRRWHRKAREEMKRRKEADRGRRLAALRSSDYEVRAAPPGSQALVWRWGCSRESCVLQLLLPACTLLHHTSLPSTAFPSLFPPPW